jgi:hypothetical protein
MRAFPGQPILELALLRRGVGARSAAQVGCVDCHRSPLPGEWVHRFDEVADGRIVCELCRSRHAGVPTRSERTGTPRPSGATHAVRATPHAA